MKKYVICCDSYQSISYGGIYAVTVLSGRYFYDEVLKSLNVKNVPTFDTEEEAYDWYKMAYNTTDEYCEQYNETEGKGFFKTKRENDLPKSIFVVPKFTI